MASKKVKRGDKGGHIATLNGVLFKKGYKKVPDPGNPQAAQEFTIETENAVKDIQKKYGMKPTGVCDPSGIIFALGKKPADFKVNPTDYRAEAKKYDKAHEEHFKKADQLMKNISDEMKAMDKRISEFRKRGREALNNDFSHAVKVIELDFEMFNESNDFIEKFELIKSIRKWEKKAEAARGDADKEVTIAARYVKEMEALLKQLKRVAT